MADLPPRPTFEPPPDRPPRHLGPPGPDDRDRYPSSSYLPRDHHESRRESYRRDYDPRDRDYDRDRDRHDRDRLSLRDRPRFNDYDRRSPPPSYRASRDFDRRRSPPPRPSYDRDRDRPSYRPRDRSPDRRDDWLRRRPPSPGPRYSDSYRRSSRSPPRRRYSRSPPPFRRPSSRSPPPPSKRLRLGHHSIGSPHSRSPSPRPRYRSPSPRRQPQYRDDRRRSPTPDRLSRRHSRPPSRASRGSRHDSQFESGEHVEARGSGRRTPELRRERNTYERSRTRSPSRPPQLKQTVAERGFSPVPKAEPMLVDERHEPQHTSQSPFPQQSQDVHMAESPSTAHAKADGSQPSPQFSSPTQPSPRPSTPREPRQRESIAGSRIEPPRQPRMQRGRGDFRGGRGGPFRGTGAEPPRGPRHRGPPTTTINTTAAPTTPGVNSQSPASAPYNGSAPATPQIPNQAPPPAVELHIEPYEQLLPDFSLFKQLKSAQNMIEIQYKDKLNCEREYKNIYRAARRALHEFDLSMIELKASEERRKATNHQLDLAREGTLGIDYVGERDY
ncbi:hypothetical protein L218DRAFT_960533 [Marasmius fiardii PR-910]|nr:hypothetical protein L218DRAFT_960533 [Marasmius fiardii PR-910]